MRFRYSIIANLIWLIIAVLLAGLPLYAQSTHICQITISEIKVSAPDNNNNMIGSVTFGNEYWCISRVHILVEGPGGLVLDDPSYEQEYELNGRDQLDFEINGLEIKSERKYTITATPVDELGNQFQCGDDELCQRQKEFSLELEKRVPIVINKIQTVDLDPDTGMLTIGLDVSIDATYQDRVLNYAVTIVEAESKKPIFSNLSQSNLSKDVYTAGQPITEQLDEDNKLRTAKEALEYNVSICLAGTETKIDEVCIDANIPFAAALQKTTWQRIREALGNPAVYAPILIILMSVIGWVIVRNARDAKGEPQLLRPPVDSTDKGLLLQVIQTPGAPNQKRQKITRFPFRIGREGNDLNFPKDIHISKPHLEIDARDGAFFVTDLNSKNHTYVNDRELTPNQPVRLRGTTVVRLGPNTELELNPEA